MISTVAIVHLSKLLESLLFIRGWLFESSGGLGRFLINFGSHVPDFFIKVGGHRDELQNPAH